MLLFTWVRIHTYIQFIIQIYQTIFNLIFRFKYTITLCYVFYFLKHKYIRYIEMLVLTGLINDLYIIF